MEERTTLKTVGQALIAIGLVWYVVAQIAPLIRAELAKLERARDGEEVKGSADDREKIIEQEQEKSLQLAQQLEREKRVRSDAERQLDKERRQQREDVARRQELETQMGAVRTKSFEDESKLEEFRRLTRSLEQAMAENRAKLIEAQLRNTAPVQKRPNVDRYYSRPGKDYGRSGLTLAPDSLPGSLGIEQISEYVGRKAANGHNRIEYRNAKTNIRVVADPISCGQTCRQIQVTVWENTHLLSRKTMIFGQSHSAYNVVRMLRNSRSAGFPR